MVAESAFDIPSLREKMLALLGEKATAYPERIEQQYPHILAKLVEVWGTPSADAYLDGLMIADRPNRQGFPGEVASEILRLSMIHGGLNLERPEANSGWLGDFRSDFDDFLERRSNR